MSRFLAVHLPALGVQVAQLPAPAAVWTARGATRYVAACDEAARRAGVRPGMRLAQARATCAALHAASLDEATCLRRLEALAEALAVLSPHVAVLQRDDDPTALPARGALVELTPVAHLLTEEAACQRAHAIAHSLGLRARVALADQPATAAVLAAQGRPHAPPGADAAALAPLPLAALGAPVHLLRLFRLAGIHTAAALAALPAGEVLRRFGPHGAHLHRIARGQGSLPLAWWRGTPPLREHLACPEPLHTRDALFFACKRLADALEVRLRGRGQAATRLRLVLHLDGAEARTLRFGLSTPTPRASDLLYALRHHLDALRQRAPLQAPVEALTLEVVEHAPWRPRPDDLFEGRPASAALDELLTRLTARLGPGAVFQPHPHPAWLPEDAWRPQRPSARKGPLSPRAPRRRRRPAFPPVRPPPPPWALPLPPCAWATPRQGAALGDLLDSPVREVHPVARLAEPWWTRTHCGHPRDYAVVTAAGGSRWWAWFDPVAQRWTLQGRFD